MEDVKSIIDFAKHSFLLHGSHEPMVFAKGTNGKVVVEMKNFGDTLNQRELSMLNMGTTIACKRNVGDLDMIAIVTEAWMGTNLEVMPSQDPKRVEVLMINYLDVTTQQEKAVMFEIVRNKIGKPIDLRPWEEPSGSLEVKGYLLPAFVRGYRAISPVRN